MTKVGRGPAPRPVPRPMCASRILARLVDMKQLEHPPVIALWQINLLRVGYVVMGGGLAVFKWPLLFDHEPWSLAEGTVECLLVGMSLLALLGLRYPVRMLPILLFEVTWKLMWLGVVALPSWLDGTLDAATREQTGKVLWVAIIIAVIRGASPLPLGRPPPATPGVPHQRRGLSPGPRRRSRRDEVLSRDPVSDKPPGWVTN